MANRGRGYIIITRLEVGVTLSLTEYRIIYEVHCLHLESTVCVRLLSSFLVVCLWMRVGGGDRDSAVVGG